ncbi:MAG: CDP-glucose 4,6-dehydratase, partial [Gemmatimonadetes bacterium]|nr:CDP-glucose 4,6-dehydratase [Gemmatimonadota bacterium]
MTQPERAFWAGRRVLVTGHSGFKGAWLSLWLEHLGARVTGLSAGAPAAASMHAMVRLAEGIEEVHADVRSFEAVGEAVASSRPEVVLHLAAQPFVRRSLRDPRTTYEVNVMGTVNVLEAARRAEGVRAVVAVTSDKAYDNRGAGRAFVEGDPMGGADPYSSSKGCAELVVDAYLRSYFGPGGPDAPRVGAARAGNVIGGGDRGEDRLVPDLVRAAQAGAPLRIRNPDAVRPWQHVLEPLSGYLALARALVDDPAAQGGWNFGPPAGTAPTVGELAARLAALWPGEVEVVQHVVLLRDDERGGGHGREDGAVVHRTVRRAVQRP